MYMREPECETEIDAAGKSWDLSLGLGLAAAGVVLLGILPAIVLGPAQDAVVKILGN
jgi:hypothetical protein